MDGEIIEVIPVYNKFFGWIAYVPGENYPVCLVSFDKVEVDGREPFCDDPSRFG